MPEIKRILILTWAFVECLLFAGLIYGWNALVYILLDQGIYADLCENPPMEFPGDKETSMGMRTTSSKAVSSQNSLAALWMSSNLTRPSPFPDLATATPPGGGSRCEARDRRMTLVYVIGFVAVAASSPVFGHVMYRHGTRVTRLLATFCFTLGFLSLAFVSPDVPWLIFPGYALIGVGGLSVMVTNIQISVLFGKGASTVVGALSGAFDASSLGFQLVKVAYTHGVALKHSCFLVLGLHAMVLVSTLAWMPKTFFAMPDPLPSARTDNSDSAEDNPRQSILAVQDTPGSGQREAIGEEPTLKSCILSPFFLLHVFWMGVLALRLGFFFGPLTVFLDRKLNGNAEEVSHFIDALQYTMIAGIVTSPAAGLFYDAVRKAFSDSSSAMRRQLLPAVVPLAVTTGLAVAMSLSLLLPQPGVLYLTFVLFLLFRSFLFSICNAFLSILFPTNYFGFLCGLVLVALIPSTFLVYPLTTWAETSSFSQVNLFLAMLTCVTLAHPAYLWWRCGTAERRSLPREPVQACSHSGRNTAAPDWH